MLRNSFSCYLRTLKIKVSPFTSNCGFPMVFTTFVPGKKCDNFNKNLDQRTLVCIRYTDKRCEKALNEVEMYFCIISSMSRNKVFWDQRCFVKGNSLCITVCCICQMHMSTFFCSFYCCCYIKRCDYMSFQQQYCLLMTE